MAPSLDQHSASASFAVGIAQTSSPTMPTSTWMCVSPTRPVPKPSKLPCIVLPHRTICATPASASAATSSASHSNATNATPNWSSLPEPPETNWDLKFRTLAAEAHQTPTPHPPWVYPQSMDLALVEDWRITQESLLSWIMCQRGWRWLL